jgi:serine/threonine protein kinase
MITNPFVLPEDIQIVSLAELPSQVRTQLAGDERDYAVTRPRSRVPSKIVDAQAVQLLREFQKPSTLVEAILRFSRTSHRKPTDVLEDAYPFLESCLAARLLVEPGKEAEPIRASFAKGAVVASYVIQECIQVLADTELYRASGPAGDAALKVTRPATGSEVKQILHREARILKQLEGRIAPRLLSSGTTEDERAFIAVEWIPAERCGETAAAMRANAREPLPEELLELCAAIIDAYATLHCLGVVHSDVHPNNVLIAAGGKVRIIDYGLSRKEGIDRHLAIAPRGGVPFFFEPEYAQAALSNSMPPLSSRAGDQYAVAALVYSLLTGHHCMDYSYEREAMLREIVEMPPVQLSARGLRGVGAIEGVLFRALAKDPISRFPDMNEMATAFRDAVRHLHHPSREAETLPATETLAGRGANDINPTAWLDSFLKGVSDPTIDLPVEGVLYPTASVTYGAAGVAYGLFRIACVREDAAIFALADRWLDRAERQIEQDSGFYHPDVQILPETVGRISPYHSPSGVACVGALMANSHGDLNARASAIERFLRFSDKECENLDVTLGRSSTLLALSMLVDASRWDSTADNDHLLKIGNDLLRGLWERFDELPAIADCQPSTFLGMAHGWAGYLYATLRWMQSAQVPAPINLEERLCQLAQEAMWQGPRASWSYQKRSGSPALGGWCNGSAGFVFLWGLAHRLLHDAKWISLARAAGFDAWQAREEGPSLCCGLAGKAYSQISLYKQTGERDWLNNAANMAARALRNTELITHSKETRISLSLYKGDVGLAVLLAELEFPDSAAMPFFEDEPWQNSQQRS